MLMSALQHVEADHVVDLKMLPDLLMQLARQPVAQVPLERSATAWPMCSERDLLQDPTALGHSASQSREQSP
jgi:hypothetical protein